MRIRALQPPLNCPNCNIRVARDFSRVVQVCVACLREFKFIPRGRNFGCVLI